MSSTASPLQTTIIDALEIDVASTSAVLVAAVESWASTIDGTGTRRVYGNRVRAFVDATNDLSPAALERWRRDLSATTQPNYVRSSIVAVRAFVRWMGRMGALPADDVEAMLAVPTSPAAGARRVPPAPRGGRRGPGRAAALRGSSRAAAQTAE